MESHHQSASHDEADMTTFGRRRCCCFWIPWSGVGSPSSPSSSVEWWERIRGAERAEERITGRWWSRGLKALMKAREWSEIVAGPRWKTFIRRFNKNPRHGSVRMGGSRYQYDPLSYALNFDEGHGGNGSPDFDGDYPDFSARFAAPPSLANSSMDLGGRDAPPLFAAPAAAAVVH